MLTNRELLVDLKLPPQDRYKLQPDHIRDARELLDVYQTDLGIDIHVMSEAAELIFLLLAPERLTEIEALADQIGVAPQYIVIGNAYYDLVKSALACSAFAVESETGPLHARNLDWHSPSDILARSTVSTRYVGAAAGEFVSIGWPGFVGVLSGMAPGRFAITLNAVLSDEPQQLALPVSLLIRDIFETATSFTQAVERLCTAELSCDCLLLVSGVEAGERVVIERTPTRHALRWPLKGQPLQVTNDYKRIHPDKAVSSDQVHSTSCGRYDRLLSLLKRPPNGAADCFALLNDPLVKMGITVQQMVFQASQNICDWRSCED